MMAGRLSSRRKLTERRMNRINSVLELLGDESIDEDERPDALKDLLSSILVMPLNVRTLIRRSRTTAYPDDAR